MNKKYKEPEINKLTDSHWESSPSWWDFLGSPLRPTRQDLDFLELELLPKIKTISSRKKIILLGVTPEIATLPWDEDTEIIAVDSSPNMIRTIWPESQVPRGKVICGDWQELPLSDSSCDLILGDGCFTLLDYPSGYQKLLQEAFRVLKPKGLLSMRFFLKPSRAEEDKVIFEQLRNKSINNFHAFKWRLAMALQKSIEEGVKVSDIWQVWQQEVSNPEKLLQDLGWPIDLLSTIDIYKGSSSFYTFPTLLEVRNLFFLRFTELSSFFPNYELGERCPTIFFQSRKC